jgi:gelsolin
MRTAHNPAAAAKATSPQSGGAKAASPTGAAAPKAASPGGAAAPKAAPAAGPVAPTFNSKSTAPVAHKPVVQAGADENGDVGQAKLEESNIAGIGSKENRDLRKDAAGSDPQYKGAGQKVGLEVWRVENKRTKADTPDFGVNRIKKEDVGTFYSGDSYIVLNTYKDRDDSGKETEALAWDLHFWLGNSSTQDEIGVAAYKTVELDDLLDDGPVQHRELQGSESRLFQSYFKEMTYLNGGHASGFRIVKPDEYTPRLLMVRRAKKTTKAYEVPCAAKSLCHGDVYVLDAGLSIYLWVGTESNAFEKSKAANLQSNIVAGRLGKAKKVNDADEHFWKTVKGTAADVSPANKPLVLPENECGKDDNLDNSTIRLWRINDESGHIKVTKVHEGAVCKWAQLDNNDVFLVHANIGIWIWIGDGASHGEKSKSMAIADKYIEINKLNKHIPVTRLLSGPKKQDKRDVMFSSMFTF